MKPALLLSSSLTLAAAVLLAWVPAAAQNRIYRCGNEYTNVLKGRKGCKLIEGGNVTVVRGTAPKTVSARGSGDELGARKPASPQRVAAAPAAAPRNDSAEQRARESDAKLILEQELRRAESRQTELTAEYNNGAPEKVGAEARNHQKYLDRVAELKASIARNQSDIDGIKRELARVSR